MLFIYNIFSKLLYWYLTSKKQRFQLLDESWNFNRFQYLARNLKNEDAARCHKIQESKVSDL